MRTSNLKAFCKNRKSFKCYNEFVQNLVTIIQILQGLRLRMVNYVEFCAGLHLSVQNV